MPTGSFVANGFSKIRSGNVVHVQLTMNGFLHAEITNVCRGGHRYFSKLLREKCRSLLPFLCFKVVTVNISREDKRTTAKAFVYICYMVASFAWNINTNICHVSIQGITTTSVLHVERNEGVGLLTACRSCAISYLNSEF